MNKIPVILAAIAITLPGIAQNSASIAGKGQFQTVALQDGRDNDRQRDDRDHDRDRGRRNNRRGYQGVLAPDAQQRFDSYYQRWLQYRATNNRSETESMQRRMADIMAQYRIPADVPYDQIASTGIGNYDNRDRDDRDRDDYRGGRRQAQLSPDDQRRFDSYYSRWLNYRRDGNRDEITSMERRMRDLMSRYNIPGDVPFDRVASRR